jgi:transcriptional regulator
MPLLQGSLDMLILRTLKGGAMHGYAITRHIKAASSEFLRVEEGSLYPALHRMEQRGWITAYWGTSESNRRAKYYQLSAEGRKQLRVETESWREMSKAIDQVLNFQG